MNTSLCAHFGSGFRLRVVCPQYGALIFALLAISACGKKEEVAALPAAARVPAGASAEVVPGTSTPAASTVVPATVPELLISAAAAFSQDRLVAPEGDNAIEYYLAVLDQDKDSVQATQGLVDLFPLGVSIAEKEIAVRNVEEAVRVIGLLDESSPGSYTVQKLKSRLAALQNQIQRDDERRLAAEQAQLAAQARAQAAATETTETPSTATQPATGSRTSRETRPVAETEPEPEVVAPPRTTPVRAVGETKDAKVVRQVQPGYPQLAYRRRLTGWVEIRFIVGVDGRVSDVQIIRADPQRTFDREAIRAVEQWMFEPALRDGKPVPSTLNRRIEFKYPG